VSAGTEMPTAGYGFLPAAVTLNAQDSITRDTILESGMHLRPIFTRDVFRTQVLPLQPLALLTMDARQPYTL
jgi:hypothetical protein